MWWQALIDALTKGTFQEKFSNLLVLLIALSAVTLVVYIILRDVKEGKLGPFSWVRGSKPEKPEAPKPVSESAINPAFTRRKSSVMEHPIFLLEEEFIRQVNKLEDGSLKGKVATVFLRDCKFPAIYRHIRQFVSECEATKGKNLSHVVRLVLEIVADYEKEAKVIQWNCRGSSFEGIPDPWNLKFAKWHEPHVDIFMHQIRLYVSSEYYSDWKKTLDACLDAFVFIMWLTISDAKSTLLELNGDIDHALEGKCKDRE